MRTGTRGGTPDRTRAKGHLGYFDYPNVLPDLYTWEGPCDLRDPRGPWGTPRH